MQRLVSRILMGGGALTSAGVAAWAVSQWPALAASGRGEEGAMALLHVHAPILAGGAAAALLGYLCSFESRLLRRPWAILGPAFAAVGASAGLIAREAATAFGLLFEKHPALDVLAIGAALLGAAVLPGVLWLFEFANRRAWTALAETCDRRQAAGAALFFNQLSLFFNPGQSGRLRSVALARFRRGIRGDAVQTLLALHAEGVRDADVLEALCKYASEQKDSEAFLRHLRELHALLPDDPEIRDTLVDELIEQRRNAEALQLIESGTVPRTEVALDRHASVLLHEGHLERAVTLARELGEVEGIPFKRSQRLLREVLSRVSEFVPALNLLAHQAERMALRDQRLRWLEKSLGANPRQPSVRDALLDIYREIDAAPKLEKLLEESLAEDPRNRLLLHEYAAVLHTNGKTEQALEVLRGLNGRTDAPAGALILEARIHMESSAWDPARAAAAKALQLQPTEDQAREANALMVQIERAVLTAEVAALVEEARLAPDDVPLQLRALERLIAGGHADKALALIDGLTTRHPEARRRVIEVLQEAARHPSVAFNLLNLLSDLLVAEGQLEDALPIIQTMAARSMDKVATIRDGAQKILRRSPHHLPTLRLLGDTYNAHGKFTEMIHSYTLYLSNGGEETEVIDRALARAYLSLSDYENARRFVNQLLVLNPSDVILLKQVLPLALKSGAAEDAHEYIKKLELVETKGAEIRALREQVDAALGERRLEVLKREIEAGRGGAATLEQLGDIARDIARYNDAITYFQRASRDPEDAARARRCRVKLAHCYMKKRLDDLCSETLREVHLSLDDDPRELQEIMDLLYQIGDLFLEAKLYDKAEKVFKQLCKIDAGYRDVLRKVEALRV